MRNRASQWKATVVLLVGLAILLLGIAILVMSMEYGGLMRAIAVTRIRASGATVTFPSEDFVDQNWIKIQYGRGKNITAADVHLLKYLPEITVVEMGGSRTNDEALAQLRDLPNLTYLSLCDGITDAGMVHVKVLTTLQSLNLWDTSVDDDGMNALDALIDLRELYLGKGGIVGSGPSLNMRSPISDAALVHVEALKHLRTLYLTSTQVTGSGLHHLADLAEIQSLYLDGTAVTDENLADISRLKGLKALGLSFTAISDAGLLHLKSLTKLEYLDLSHTSITDAGLASIGKLTGLDALNLGGTKMTDAGISQLRHLSLLKAFYLDDTSVSDGAITDLETLQSLEIIGVEHTSISGSGADRLAKSLPHIFQIPPFLTR